MFIPMFIPRTGGSSPQSRTTVTPFSGGLLFAERTGLISGRSLRRSAWLLHRVFEIGEGPVADVLVQVGQGVFDVEVIKI